jgi:hypothetical protein
LFGLTLLYSTRNLWPSFAEAESGFNMPLAVDTKDLVLQKFSAHALAQATVKARASGELVFAHAPEKYTEGKDAKELAQILKLYHHPSLPLAHPDGGAGTPSLPTQLGPFNAPNINFDNGVPVGGSMSLALFQDGGFSFSGHFHDSGGISYIVEGVWVIVSDSGKAFTFGAKGSVYGTFEPGSRNWDFAQNGKNDAIRDAWPDLCAGYHWRWSAYVNWNVKAAVDQVVEDLKTAGVVIGAVVAVVALL